MNSHQHALCLLAMLTAQTLGAGTVYPMLEPRFAYAAHRHLGESRVGTVGTINKVPQLSLATTEPACEGAGSATQCSLQFRYSFLSGDNEEFVSAFFSFGRTAVNTALVDGSPGPDVVLREDGIFDFTDLFENAVDDGVSIETLRFVLRPDGRDQTLTLKFELEDAERRKMFRRVAFDSRGATPVAIDLALTDFTGAIDLIMVKLVAIVVEENNFGDGVTNPGLGGFLIESIGLVDEDGPDFEAATLAELGDEELIEVVARRDFEALLRLTDQTTGASLDRTLFRDLFH